MERTSFQFTEIFPNLFVYAGAVNTGILRWGDRALLIDCDDTLTPARLETLGIREVERIYCTQHRRPNTAGAAGFGAEVFAPRGERQQFEEAAAYWQAWRNRWHLYHFRPGTLAPLHDIPLRGTVGEGDAIEWGSFTIHVQDTPGMTDGAVSYMVEGQAGQGAPRRVVFCGDTLYAAGQVWDVHSLQKAMGGFGDYHGFLGAAKTLVASLQKLGAIEADWLIPSHGSPIDAPSAATQRTAARLEQLYRNYASISALNYYFPHIFQELREDPWRMAPADTFPFPDFILPVLETNSDSGAMFETSFAIRSDSGALFLIDCGHDGVLDTLLAWKEQGVYTRLEGCWVTHYHDDHVDSLHHLAASMPVPIYADEHLAEILAHPSRFLLPCLSPAAVQVAHATADGETWRWQEFELTALHLPGQSFYHGGLLVKGHGLTALFCGDSFAPTGLDDYTVGNRNFLGAGQGFRRCIDLVRQHRPDLILNQHQRYAFHFSEAQLDTMERMLIEREVLLAELLPWEHPNFGTDEGWIRAYPYELETCAGGTCQVEVRATVHASQAPALAAEAVLPPSWTAQNTRNAKHAAVSVGEVNGERLVRACLSIDVPQVTKAGSYPVAFRVTWGGRYLGQVCHALVNVW